MQTEQVPKRFIGLDIHRKYFVAAGVDSKQNPVLGPHEAPMRQIEKWAKKNLTPADAVVVEMTTNTYAVYDALKPLVHSVTVVHPPHVALIVRAQVKTDKKAAFTLAQLHAAGLLPAVWIPPIEVREMRALVAHRRKMVKLSSIAKCRLHALLHRHDIEEPEGFELFTEDMQAWWKSMKVSPLEKQCMLSDMATLEFAREQVKQIEAALNIEIAKDARAPLLVQITGIGLLTAVTILSAIGDIRRFPTAKQLVGYTGLGARVHASGMTYSTGRITKSGRKDLRWAMVQAARQAVAHHPHFKVEYERLSKRIGTKKAIVAVARKLLVVVWQVLTKETADKFANPTQVACGLFAFAHRARAKNLPNGQRALEFVREQMDRLGIGEDVAVIPWGTKTFKLPKSKLKQDEEPELHPFDLAQDKPAST
ncbi:MAG: IS110 family transposase [Chloroflexi bacterium]|nr:IS110 family transposase [Chloroflexota bacterium]